jgi:hypothetical protein
MSDSTERYTLFSGIKRLTQGDLQAVALAAMDALNQGITSVVVLSDMTGRPCDLDLRGTRVEISKRYKPPEAEPVSKPARGRPKLGVVAREVTLLPRHWDWLAKQPGGASAALRRLVEQARRDGAASSLRREAQEAAHRVMTVLAGDLPGYESALRAFYAGDEAQFLALTAAWPEDVATYIQAHAAPAFTPTD